MINPSLGASRLVLSILPCLVNEVAMLSAVSFALSVSIGCEAILNTQVVGFDPSF